ncbi:MAG: UPF0182 family protein, partial [Chloroflexota bacterium]|nr:UPF0182 family protein [Chloroflexota bacterium]
MIVATAVILGLFLALFATAGFWVNWLWFGSVGYRSVLVTRYVAQATAFVAGGLLAAGFFAANWLLALRRGWYGTRPGPAVRPARLALWGLTAAVFLLAGSAAADRWQTWLVALRGGAFGVDDPVFGRDAGFYVLTVPALASLHSGAITLVLATALVVAAVYALSIGLARFDWRRPPLAARTHVLALGGVLLLLLGMGYLLANYGLLSSQQGFVYGGGYTAVNVDRWANYALALISVAAAALLLLNAFVQNLRWLLITFGAWAVATIVLGVVAPAAVQQTIVEPNELSRERPYIENNIAQTRAAFALEGAETRELSGQGEPPASELTPASPAFDNIRLWDYRVVQQAFRSQRSFAPYYVFPDVDVDRYQTENGVRQVLVSARELDVDGLEEQVRGSWTNRHLVYTHGYGVVVSPVSEATTRGLPRFLVGDIPPEGTGALAIERPEIYFGEAPSDWVAVGTNAREATGIPGDTEARPYEGEARGSIGLANPLERLLLAANLGDRRVLISGEWTGESRVLLRRTVRERAEAIAPFLNYDADPYIVVADGRLVWVMDAYTQTDRFPGATPIDGVNYLRHTAKVTIDAYDGTVTFYRTGVPDPIADAYGEIFGDLFTPIAEAPPALSAHFRYPERLFNVQADAYARYHVTDPNAFYNGDDRWAVAREQIEGDRPRDNQSRRMEAYYVTLPLPGEAEPGFGLVLPFTPNNRENMRAWMAGQTDASAVPRLVVYRFPPQSNIAGPQQIENSISANAEISERISLLGTTGSRVILGNLLVIPIGESVLYAQPFYVQASDDLNAPPELRFVILGTNERIVMRPTLEEALSALAAGATQTVDPADAGPATDAPASPADQP